jgi:hypothetical protein
MLFTCGLWLVGMADSYSLTIHYVGLIEESQGARFGIGLYQKELMQYSI